MSRTSGYASGNLPDPAIGVLAALRTPLHGYAIMALLDELGDPVLSMGPATLYTTLKKLLASNLIEEVDGVGTRRPYRRTEAGTAALHRNLEQRRKLLDFAQSTLEET